MGDYVYKYVYQNEIIYIGKAKNLNQRIYQHSNEDKFKDFEKSEIYFLKLANSIMSDVVESELIRRYKPRLNIAKKSDWDGIEFVEPKWHKYTPDIDKQEKLAINLERRKKFKEDQKLKNNLDEKYWVAVKVNGNWNISIVPMTIDELNALATELIFHTGEIYGKCFGRYMSKAIEENIMFDKNKDLLESTIKTFEEYIR